MMNFDLRLLRSYDDARVALDVFIMAYWLRVSSGQSLKHLAKRYIG